MAAISPQVEAIFAKVTGRAPESSKDRAFLSSAAQRKSGGALQGAIEFAQNQGTLGGSQSSQQSGDPLDEQVTRIKDAGRKVQQAHEKIIGKEMQFKVREELLKSPAIQMLLKMEGQSDKALGDTGLGVEGSALARPTQQGALTGQNLGNILQTQGDIGRSFASRGAGITDVINSITSQRQQEVDTAKTGLDTERGVLQDLLDVSGERREQALLPLEQEKIRAEIDKLRATAGDSNVIPGDASTLSDVSRSVLTNPALYKTITPTQRQQVLKQLTAYGADAETLTALTTEFSDKTRAEITGYDALSSKVQQALTALSGGSFGTGPAASRYNEFRATTPLGAPPGWNEYAALTNVSSAEKLKELTGVQFAEKEYDRLKEFLPNSKDQEAVALSKLKLFLQETEKLKAERISNQFKNILDFKEESLGESATEGTTSSGIKYTIE